jgi:hypothetical protein
VKPGDLVKITRASISMPAGTLGLIVKDGSCGSGMRNIWFVEVYGAQHWPAGVTRRFLAEDLEIVRE